MSHSKLLLNKFVFSGEFVSLNDLMALDSIASRFINSAFSTPWLDWFMILISSSYTHAWIIGALLLVKLRSKDWWGILIFMVAALVALGADAVSYEVLKPFFERLRPCHEFPDVTIIVDRCGGRFSFPSNHATNAAAVAATLWLFMGKQWGSAASCLALIIGISRVYLGVHYLGDVLFGFLLGATSGTVAFLVLHKRILALKAITKAPTDT